MTQEEDTQATASAEVTELEGQITELTQNLEVLNGRISRLGSQKELLKKYSDGLFSAGGRAKTGDLLDPKTAGECMGSTVTQRSGRRGGGGGSNCR